MTQPHCKNKANPGLTSVYSIDSSLKWCCHSAFYFSCSYVKGIFVKDLKELVVAHVIDE